MSEFRDDREPSPQPSPALRDREGPGEAGRVRARRWFALAFLGGAVMTLAGCARKSRPEHPPGSEYPLQYPTQ